MSPKTGKRSSKPEKFSRQEKTKLALTAPTNENELWDYVATLWNIKIPYQSCCPSHVSPFEAFYHAYFATKDVIIWKASRKLGGKTFLLATLALTEQVSLGATISLLGGSLQQSERVHDYLSGRREAENMFWDAPHAPRHILASDPSRQKSWTKNGGYIQALAASSKSARGPHPQRLRLDEVDEMEIDIVDDSLGQPKDKEDDEGNVLIEQNTVMSSTHQYPDGTMTEVLDRAESPEKDWMVVEWCDRETRRVKVRFGFTSEAEIEKTKNTMSKERFETEVRMNEPSSEESAIDRSAVEASFLKSKGEFEGVNGEEIIIHEPGQGIYVHGADWAKDVDWTIILTFLKKKGWDHFELAAFERMGRMKWPYMIGAFNDRVEKYGGMAYHDITGVGNVVDDYLTVRSYGHKFGGQDTKEMLTNYIVAMEDGKVKCPHIQWMKTEHKRATTSEIYGSDHLPDTIAAGALAMKAAQEHGGIGLTLRR